MPIDALNPVDFKRSFHDPNPTRPLFTFEYFDARIGDRRMLFSEPVVSDLSYDLKGRIYSFFSLNNNWDGYGGVKPQESVLNNCIYFLKKLPKKYLQDLTKDDVSLTPYGTIVLDWETSEKLLSIEIGEDSIGYFIEASSNEKLSSEGIKYFKNEVPSELAFAFSKFYS